MLVLICFILGLLVIVKLISIYDAHHSNLTCPKCGSKLKYRILEQNKSGYHEVYYECPKCGWKIILSPEDES